MSYSFYTLNTGLPVAEHLFNGQLHLYNADVIISSNTVMALVGLLLVAIFCTLLIWRIGLVKKSFARQIDDLQAQLETVGADLQQTREQLKQAEKMASLGELTAGIAHEIQNPLNFVNNFAEINAEIISDIKSELTAGNADEVQSLTDDLKDNNEKIAHHGKRADSIIKGMLKHSRSTGQKEPTKLNALADEYLKLAYHGLRAKDKSFNATINTNYDPSIETIELVSQDMGRVILNLITNAFYSVNEKLKSNGNGYKPTVTVSTKKEGNKLYLCIEDNGNGVPASVMDKIFQPFFTTKPTGHGTGLGLSLSHDIIKQHSGTITVDSKEGEGAKFTIELPA